MPPAFRIYLKMTIWNVMPCWIGIHAWRYYGEPKKGDWVWLSRVCTRCQKFKGQPWLP